MPGAESPISRRERTPLEKGRLRLEIVLWIVGLLLLGSALATIVKARVYQARQERLFLEQERAAKLEAPSGTKGPVPVPEPAADAAVLSTVKDAGSRAGKSLPGRFDPRVLGMIEIPRLGVSAMVRNGADDATLEVAVGRIPGTAMPGEPGNMALAGHRDSFFRPLRHIKRNDSIWIRTPTRRDEYQVVSMEIVKPEDTRVLNPTNDAALTLVTCHPFDYVGHAPNRFIVRACRIP